MKKFNINDFTKMMPPNQNLGGSVAKSVQKQAEAFNGQIPGGDAVFETGGSISDPTTLPKSTPSDSIGNSTSKTSSGIDPIVVVTLIVAGGLIAFGVIKILQDREMYNANNN